MPGDARTLLVSTYELGHQPWHLATTAGFLRDAGLAVRCRDVAVEELTDDDLRWATMVAVAVPMHTAMRLAREVVARVRRLRGAEVRVVLFGLYAPHGAGLLPEGWVDAAVGGEFEAELVRLAGGGEPATRTVFHDRLTFPAPARDLLPSPERYARLLWRGESRLAGYVEASRGCVHRCRHCPVPVVYAGRIRVVAAEVVAADAAAQWERGVRHLTIGDPDFLNAVPHALRVARLLHDRLPELTFDVTTKVEHILEHSGIWAELASLGLLFVTSAVESTSDAVLAILDKGHTRADISAALDLLDRDGVTMRPSLLPFTPWSTLADYLDLLDLVDEHALWSAVDPVQLGIRLLLPEGSLLLGRPEMAPHLRGRGPDGSWRWEHPDPGMDALAEEVAAITAEAADRGEDGTATHRSVRAAAGAHARRAGLPWDAGVAPRAGGGCEGPRLSEAWFCCAEPTAAQVRAAR